MNRNSGLSFFDVHWLLSITIASIAVLQFGVFSTLGLVLYGVLLAYNFVGIILNCKNKRINWTFTFVTGAGYFLYYIFASLFNGNFIDIASVLFQYLLIFIISFFIRDEKYIEKDFLSLAKILTISGLAMAVLSILLAVFSTAFPDFFSSLPDYEVFYELKKRTCNIAVDRLVGFGGNPITTAFYCYVSVAFSIYLLSRTVRFAWKITALCNFIISSFTISFLARSRTYMGALATFLIIYFFIYYCVINKDNPRKWKNFKIILTLAFILFALFLILFFVSSEFKSFILNDVLRIQNINTIGNREYIFENSLAAGDGHRLFGINTREFEKEVAYHTHNMYLEILTFGGVPSLVLFMLYTVSAIIVSVKNFIFKNHISQVCLVINCLALAYIISYLVGGISEPGAVRSMRIAFPVYNTMIATVCVIRANSINSETLPFKKYKLHTEK